MMKIILLFAAVCATTSYSMQHQPYSEIQHRTYVNIRAAIRIDNQLTDRKYKIVFSDKDTIKEIKVKNVIIKLETDQGDLELSDKKITFNNEVYDFREEYIIRTTKP